MDVAISPVRLKYALSQTAGFSGANPSYTYIKVKAQNIEAENQQVKLIYKDVDGGWKSEFLVLEGNYGNYDVFGAINAPFTDEFALEYKVDDDSYWDSNNGVNYKLFSNNNAIGGNVILNKATVKVAPEGAGESKNKIFWVEGEIYISKIAYHKRVGIKLSFNEGNSWQEIDATYQGVEIEGASGNLFNTAVEFWKFKTPTYHATPSDADLFRFVVYYKDEATGTWYWDNNFGQDYILSKVNGFTIE